MQQHEEDEQSTDTLETVQQDTPNEPLRLEELNLQVEAEEFRTLGRERQEAGDVDDAAAYFQMSVDLFPTAEAYTFLGHTLAARGHWQEAIVQCERAISLKPSLGNPYNDIGVYLIELNRLDEALGYLDRALRAPEYDCRNYPHYHRGRVLERMTRFGEARDAYYEALQIDADWEPARAAFFRVLGWLN
jgi:Tfp pilus assembly protein PilF